MTHSPAASGTRPVSAPRRQGTIAAALAAVLTAAVAVAQAPPKITATLTRTSVPAAGRQEAIATVSAFGYYAFTVASPQGTALQLVDRMAGPGRQSGESGSFDGRLDLFLDRGEYKLIAIGHEKASGNIQLEVHPFAELHAPQPPLLVELKPVDETLQDFQQAEAKLQAEKRESLSALRSAITVLQGRGGGLAPSSHPADCPCTVCYSMSLVNQTYNSKFYATVETQIVL